MVLESGGAVLLVGTPRVDHAREHVRVTISDIVKLTGTSRNTLKQHFRQLVAQGHLALHGSGRGAWYVLP
jgi:hypothetical protein